MTLGRYFQALRNCLGLGVSRYNSPFVCIPFSGEKIKGAPEHEYSIYNPYRLAGRAQRIFALRLEQLPFLCLGGLFVASIGSARANARYSFQATRAERL